MSPEARTAETARDLPLLAIYADESCLGNGREGSNPGGAAGVIEYVHAESGNLGRWDYWISEPGTTNNRMALRSAIEAFRGISRKGARFRVTFTSDSQYLVKGMSEWVFSWMSRDWKKEGPASTELWKEAVEAARPHQLDPKGAVTRAPPERVRNFRRRGGPRTDDVRRHRPVAVRRLAGPNASMGEWCGAAGFNERRSPIRLYWCRDRR